MPEALDALETLILTHFRRIYAHSSRDEAVTMWRRSGDKSKRSKSKFCPVARAACGTVWLMDQRHAEGVKQTDAGQWAGAANETTSKNLIFLQYMWGKLQKMCGSLHRSAADRAEFCILRRFRIAEWAIPRLTIGSAPQNEPYNAEMLKNVDIIAVYDRCNKAKQNATKSNGFFSPRKRDQAGGGKISDGDQLRNGRADARKFSGFQTGGTTKKT